MEQNQKETKATLKTGDRITSVPASDALLERLKQIPTSVREGYDAVPKKVIWTVAASIAFLIALNVVSAKDYADKANSAQTESINTYFDHLKSL